MTRKPSLTARMAGLLDRMAYAVEMYPLMLPDEKQHLTDLNSPRESFAPSSARLAEEARALIAEHRKRGVS